MSSSWNFYYQNQSQKVITKARISPDLVDEVSSTLFTILAYGHCCNLRAVVLSFVPVLVLRLLLCCNSLWGSALSMKVMEICSKTKKKGVITISLSISLPYDKIS